MDVEKVFENVTGRKMGPDEVTRYLKFQKEFEVPDTDPTWMIFIWFEFYQRIFEQFPENARKEAEEVAHSLRDSAGAVTDASAAVVKESRDKAVVAIGILQEETKKNISGALGTTLDDQIGKAVERLEKKSNRPLHKNWLIASGIGVLIAVIVGGWGFWTFYQYAKNVGEAEGSNPFVAGAIKHLLNCDIDGWKTRWVKDGNGTGLYCDLYPNSKNIVTGLRIK